MAELPEPRLPSQSLADATRPTTRRDSGGDTEDPHRRRISYFMLVRLALLALFTVVAGILAWQADDGTAAIRHGFVWGTLVVGYALTLLYARYLPRIRDLRRFALLQTMGDILLAAVVVQVTGGADSGFVSLYLIAVLGAATMGGVRQTWGAAGACTAIYMATSVLEALGAIEPMSLGQPIAPLPLAERASEVARTLLALASVTVLSSFLNKQLTSSAAQVGDLRAMNENILRSLRSGIIGVDNDARVIYFNPAAQAMLGLHGAAIGRDIERLLPGVTPVLHGHSRQDMPGARTTNPSSERTELCVRGALGTPLQVSLSCTRLRDGQARTLGQLIEFQDISRMHELAEQVRRSERLAAVGGLAASVAHEIRNPLAAISGSAELLTPSIEQDDDGRLLSIIVRESGRLSDLVTDMLAFTRPRAPQAVAMSLARTAEEALENFRADPANSAMEANFTAQPTPQISADPAQLSQVLWNLLRNAAEAQGGSGRIDVAVAFVAGPAVVELLVTDQGPGIPAERRERIFDPFFTTKERGTGFGLATVHRIVQDNGGDIEVLSPPGEGATFRLWFPALPQTSRAAVDDSETSEKSATSQTEA